MKPVDNFSVGDEPMAEDLPSANGTNASVSETPVSTAYWFAEFLRKKVTTSPKESGNNPLPSQTRYTGRQ